MPLAPHVPTQVVLPLDKKRADPEHTTLVEVTNGVTDGVTDGVTNGVTTGVTDGVTTGVTDGVTDGAADGVTDGVTDGGTDGVTDGVADGATGAGCWAAGRRGVKGQVAGGCCPDAPLPPTHPYAHTHTHTHTKVGPRMAMQPIRVFEGSFAGATLYENPAYVSPNAVRRMVKQRAAGKYNAKVR